MDRESGRAYVDDEAEIVKARDKTLGKLGLVAAVEMVGSEVAIIGTVAKHVVSGREHRRRHGQYRFLRAPATFDPQELSAKIAVFLTSGGPRGLDERGLEPRVARARAIGQAFAGALVQAGTETRPRHEVGGAREAGHVEADFGDDHARDGFTDPRHGDQ